MYKSDAQFMGLASRLSRRNLGMCWPNPCVGAVVVSGCSAQIIVGEGATQPGGRPHAEPMALAMAGEKAKGATLYVTLEPCSHVGRSPPCTGAIIDARIARVVYGAVDPDPRVAGKGLELLRDAGIEVTPAPAARPQHMSGLEGHFKRVKTGMPFVQLKLAVGSDNKIKPGDGTPQWVTGKMGRARGHLLRAHADAILIGKGTMLADNPSLTCRLPGLENRSPIRVIVDARLETPIDADMLTTADKTPVWVFCAKDTPEDKIVAFQERGAVVETVQYNEKSERLDVKDVLKTLSARGLTRLLVEGGPLIAKSLIDGGLVDEAVIFKGGAPAGSGGLDPLAGAGLERVTNNVDFQKIWERSLDNDKMTVYRKV